MRYQSDTVVVRAFLENSTELFQPDHAWRLGSEVHYMNIGVDSPCTILHMRDSISARSSSDAPADEISRLGFRVTSASMPDPYGMPFFNPGP